MRVVGWLSSRHGYSTTFLPGEGDPIRWFLEHPGSDAHCEVFASATALLLRSVGIPARYVVGYLAHERDRQGNWIVRARDAHAWVEAWCDGEQWVTIEATPAAGTPAGRETSVPWWRRFVEEISDTAIGLRDTVVNSDPALVSIGVGVVALAAMTSAILIRRRPTTNGPADFGNPVDPRLRHRIEGMLARHGSPVAENLTWLAAVSALPDADPVKEPLCAYLRLLCADRFGGGTDGSVLATAWESVLNADQTWKHQSG